MTVCAVSECSNPTKRNGFCYGHYMKNWRYGTPTPSHQSRVVDIRGKRFGTLVVVKRKGHKWLCKCDCGRARTVDAGNLNRYGQNSTCGYKPAHRSTYCKYGAAHERVKSDKGPASQHPCVDCGHQAHHWSYNHDDPDELTADDLGGLPYSLNSACYSPRCVPCHKLFDLGRLTDTFKAIGA